MNEETEKMTIDELHPSHAEALKTAKLAPETHPTLRTTHDEENNEKRKKERNEKRKRHKDRRTVFFCIACSKHWKKPLPKIIQDLKKKHGLSWLRVQMSHTRSSNLHEIFQADLHAETERKTSFTRLRKFAMQLPDEVQESAIKTVPLSRKMPMEHDNTQGNVSVV